MDDPLVEPPIDIRPTEAVQVGEGAGDLPQDGEEQLPRDGLAGPHVADYEDSRGCRGSGP